MCQYCEVSSTKYSRREQDFLSGDSHLELFLLQTPDYPDEWYMELIDNESDYDTQSVRIHYCPVCGRPLG